MKLSLGVNIIHNFKLIFLGKCNFWLELPFNGNTTQVIIIPVTTVSCCFFNMRTDVNIACRLCLPGRYYTFIIYVMYVCKIEEHDPRICHCNHMKVAVQGFDTLIVSFTEQRINFYITHMGYIWYSRADNSV